MITSKDVVRDEETGYYLYRMSYCDDSGRPRVVSGVCGILELSSAELTDSALDIGAPVRAGGHLLAHEQTISSGNSSHESSHLIARPGSGPVWALATRDELQMTQVTVDKRLSEIIDRASVSHELFRIVDPVSLDRIALSVESAQLIIADGHHRIERAMKRIIKSDAYTVVKLLCFVTNLSSLDAEIRPIHRCFKTDLDFKELWTRLETRFRLHPMSASQISIPSNTSSLIALIGDKAYSLSPRTATPHTNDAIQAQEVARLLEARSTQYLTDIQKLREKIKGDNTKIGIVTRPVSIRQIREAALRKKPLPAKSTLFYPKPLPGMLLGELLNL